MAIYEFASLRGNNFVIEGNGAEDAWKNLCLREKENLNDEELEEAGKLLQIVKDNYQKIIELIVQL